MKRTLSIVLIMLLFTITLSACDGNRKLSPFDPSQVTEVTATDSPTSSYLYVINDRKAIAQLCEFYNSLTYRELKDGEEKPDNLLLGKLYSLHFNNAESEHTLASCYVSPDGYLLADDYKHPYKLTSSFNEEQLRALLEKYNAFK